MKKQLINEAFRLQQLAGIQPINSLNEKLLFDKSNGLGTGKLSWFKSGEDDVIEFGSIFPKPSGFVIWSYPVFFIPQGLFFVSWIWDADQTSISVSDNVEIIGILCVAM